jgi:hypothetical protein
VALAGIDKDGIRRAVVKDSNGSVGQEISDGTGFRL